MTQSYSRSSQLNSAVRDEDSFSDIIAAISEGKYSWACVLILKSAGYNPLHYMPYRTYNRIIKANLNLGKKRVKSTARASERSEASCFVAPQGAEEPHRDRNRSDCRIADLAHLRPVSEESRQEVRGGRGHRATEGSPWWSTLFSVD